MCVTAKPALANKNCLRSGFIASPLRNSPLQKNAESVVRGLQKHRGDRAQQDQPSRSFCDRLVENFVKPRRQQLITVLTHRPGPAAPSNTQSSDFALL